MHVPLLQAIKFVAVPPLNPVKLVVLAISRCGKTTEPIMAGGLVGHQEIVLSTVKGYAILVVQRHATDTFKNAVAPGKNYYSHFLV